MNDEEVMKHVEDCKAIAAHCAHAFVDFFTIAESGGIIIFTIKDLVKKIDDVKEAVAFVTTTRDALNILIKNLEGSND